MNANFNICIIKPPGYIHSYAFLELGQLIHFSLVDLGLKSEMNFNAIKRECINIIFGIHLLNHSQQSEIPSNSIIFNTEQLGSANEDWTNNILRNLKSHIFWDYSLSNIELLKKLDCHNIKYFQFGYQKKLHRILKGPSQPIDVLFYGSLNPRRAEIINLLRKLKVNVHTSFSVYAAQRDNLISQSKIVLNIHHYDSQIFEIVRVSYLLNNAKAVVSEVNLKTSIESRYLAGIYASSYDNLTQSCLRLIEDAHLRNELEEKSLAVIKKFPQAHLLSNIL
jgi:hypothetical protein